MNKNIGSPAILPLCFAFSFCFLAGRAVCGPAAAAAPAPQEEAAGPGEEAAADPGPQTDKRLGTLEKQLEFFYTKQIPPTAAHYPSTLYDLKRQRSGKSASAAGGWAVRAGGVWRPGARLRRSRSDRFWKLPRTQACETA